MSIRVVCPNGHPLQVKAEMAGKSGLCPLCKMRVDIPRPADPDFSEQSIMDVLGTPAAAASRRPEPASTSSSGILGRDGQNMPKKSCYKCKQEIPKSTTICPLCKTFIGNMDS